MNQLYNKADAILTKPGGVTISEALQKKLPILVHTSLPGQEEINLDYLLEKIWWLSFTTGKLLNSLITKKLYLV